MMKDTNKTSRGRFAAPSKRLASLATSVAVSGGLLVGAGAAGASFSTAEAAQPAATSSSSVISAAQRYTGIPYVWGGASTSGADCSGYVALVYKSLGKSLPHNSDAMQRMATPVSNPRPGDLVFQPGHVGIYAGNGKAYQALHPGTTSGLSPIYGSHVSYGRI